MKASDGIVLKASYFAAAKPGPGVLLFHQSNRTRKSWDPLGRRLASSGIDTLTLDMRGFGDSGGKPNRQLSASDIDLAWGYLVSQPGVRREIIGVGGAGVVGVDNAVQTARRHPGEVKSLVLMSGETTPEGRQFMHAAAGLPALFVVDDSDEYPPIAEAMELLYVSSSNSGRKLVHYSAAKEAPWMWYEPIDVGKVPPNGSHGTDMFERHAELAGLILQWLQTTLIDTPGRAPPDTLASAPIVSQIAQIEAPDGDTDVRRQLTEARRRDPNAELWPEITVSEIAQDHLRAKNPQLALEIFELNLLAYPESADAHDNIADAYLALGRKAQARQHAERALALLDEHAVPASSWTDTEPYRGEIRRDAHQVLDKLKRNDLARP